MTTQDGPPNIAKELATLKHEKKNQSMKNLPEGTTIQRRPLSHPSVASPFAGPHVQKVVYVSRNTPIMSAVKRVKKLLQHVEKRAIQSAGIDLKGTHQNRRQLMVELAGVSDKLAKAQEEVLVKASGRAMEQALRVAEWFRNREQEMMCKVEVRTGSVAAVDDIVEAKTVDEDVHGDKDDEVGRGDVSDVQEITELEGGDTTMELLGSKTATDTQHANEEKTTTTDKAEVSHAETDGDVNHTKKKRRKRKRAAYDKDDLPEARIRWVKTVEIAISLKA